MCQISVELGITIIITLILSLIISLIVIRQSRQNTTASIASHRVKIKEMKRKESEVMNRDQNGRAKRL